MSVLLRERGGSQHAFLVIHPGALGDVLQAVPALRALGSTGSLTFSGQPRLGILLCGLGLVEDTLPFDGLGLEALFTLTAPPPSLVDRLSRFHRVISWFGARDDVYVEQLRAISRDCVIAPPQPDEASPQTVWRHLLATVDAAARRDLSPVAVPPAWQDAGERALRSLGVTQARPLVVVQPGAGGRWKLWPVEHQAAVIRQVIRDTAAQVLIHKGPADHEIVETLSRILDDEPLHLIEPELPLLAAVLRRAAAYLGVDSGVSHLAAAVGARAVILFRPATRDRWEPWSQTARMLTMSDEAEQVDGVAAALIEGVRARRASRSGAGEG